MKTSIKILIATLFCTLGIAHAQILASDNAGNYSGWANGDNGGFGFGPWSLTPGDGGHFLGFSSEGGERTPTIDTGGQAFGMWNGGSEGTDATRGFASGVWGVGSVLSLDISFRFDGGSRGVTLIDSDGEIFFLAITGAGYEWSGGGNAGPTPWDDQREFGEIISLTFTQSTSTDLDFAFQGIRAGSPSASGTVDGTLDNFRIFNAAGEGGGGNDFFVNNLQVIPEPATLLLLVGGLGFIAALRRKMRA